MIAIYQVVSLNVGFLITPKSFGKGSISYREKKTKRYFKALLRHDFRIDFCHFLNRTKQVVLTCLFLDVIVVGDKLMTTSVSKDIFCNSLYRLH